MYYESLWNHVVIQQGVFNRLKITYYIASSMKLKMKIHEASDFTDSQILEKMQKLIRKRPKCFANCELWVANLNPDYNVIFSRNNLFLKFQPW